MTQRREEPWLAGCVSDTFPTQHNTTPPRGGPWQSRGSPGSQTCAGQCSWTKVRDGCQVSATLGQALGLAVWRCVLQLAKKTDCEPWLSTSAPETVPSARGPGGESLPSQTSCRAPDVDLSSPAEAENAAKTQSEPQSAGTFVSHT